MFGKPRRRSTPSPELAAALGDLRRLPSRRPELTAAAETLAAALAATFDGADPDRPTAADGPTDEVRRALERGEPALSVLTPSWDVSGRALAIGRAIGDESLCERIRRDRAWFRSACVAALSGRHEDVAEAAGRGGLDPSRLASVVRLALLPALAALARSLEAAVAASGWRHGSCPICGIPPLLAESRGLEQRRVLRCGRCASGWDASRLACPACGESDPRRLLSLAFEGEGDRYRLACCGACGGRLKVISTLGPLSAPGLLVAELETLHLDAIPDPAAEDR